MGMFDRAETKQIYCCCDETSKEAAAVLKGSVSKIKVKGIYE